jgi:metallophosphoesterase (TIGR00282 family)
MNFYSWSRNDPLKINKFGIPEPISSKIFYPDILLVPLVAYDSSLNRLGYGGGYYDRYIEKIEKIKKVTKIGLAFSFQKISSIPINQYDKKLDFIVTEKEILQMKILFLGDVVGISGCSKLMNNLMNEIKSKNIDFVIVNGENAASQGVGLTKEICHDFFNCGVNVITTGNHVWDQKEIMEYIDKEERLLRPKNLFEPAPGRGFNIYNTKNDIKIGVLNLMGNVFMKKCDDVFEVSEKFMKQFNLKKDYDLLVVDFHGEITSEKNAIGHYFDGKASLVVGTHTHIPTNDARILTGGTGYQTDAGMCGDYNSVIGMNAENSLNRFLKKNSVKHFPAIGDATLCGVIVECNINTGLATNIESYIFGAQLKNTH